MVQDLKVTADRRFVVRPGWCLCLLMIQFCTSMRDAAAQEPVADLRILQSVWGWNGYAKTEAFAPLSVKVRNNSSQPWSGTFRLSMADAAGTPIGATTERQVTLPAQAEEWVQLIPYIVNDSSQWVLSWGTAAKDSVTFDGSETGLNADVMLTPDDNLRSSSPFPKLPAKIFPQSVAGIAGLSKLMLDFAPNWNDAQRQVFLDWLHAGGQVIVCQTEDQSYPKFGGDLQVLDHPAERLRVGTGLVTKVPRRVTDTDWLSMVSHVMSENTRARNLLVNQRTFRRNQEYHHPIALGDQAIFQQLLERVRFNRNWLLVNVSVIAYLMMLFPVCYFIGHRKKKVRGFYISFLGSIFSFSLLFWMIGQLGASEQNRIASVAVAQSVGRNRLTVTQWSQLAAVHELDTKLTHDGIGLWYGTGQQHDRARGILQGDVDPYAQLKFPPASTRTLMLQETLTTNKPAPTIAILDEDEATVRDLKFSIAGSFENPPITAWAVYRELAFPLELKGDSLRMKERAQGIPLVNFLVESRWWEPKIFGLQPPQDRSAQKPDPDVNLFQLLLASSLGVTNMNHSYVQLEGQDRIKLAVLTAMPDEFFARSNDFRQQSGQVLWIYELPAGK